MQHKIETEELKLKKTLKGYLLGFLSAAVLVSGVTYAASTTTLYDVISNGIKIVVDGQKLNPTDANGNTVEPIIYNGTTYLPVRAVANALGKAVYWDGPNYTVYLGDMNGGLEYPTKELSADDNIGGQWRGSNQLKDNYGNIYSSAITPSDDEQIYETLCNMKYSRFKGTIYVAEGYSYDYSSQIIIKADNKTIYTSPEITKISHPIQFDVNITGCNNLKIIATSNLHGFWRDDSNLNIGNAGFYQ